ncbi:Glutamate--cysteine ligase [Rubrivivax sp. A210]|uniref:glutamate--cysteine ligase n=1 Tax=Rubrivivax sp. A210 TaxID=2772301 RepID=UPI00191A6FD4|nr:glutamate--cysteine ligase [Rubrivivax sp. A210]CAD5373276.1 Glutamate--cysteine ligase [Rubrivivax sp. A210]
MSLADRLRRLSPERLQGMRRGIEKESLRAKPSGALALTPHPAALGSPLTHPRITTDYCESQLELITGVHGSVQACLDELTEIHQFVVRELADPCCGAGDERLWVGSMPCGLPPDETIPIGSYGRSNIGRAKSVYRMGLGHRYGRRMQTISGIHYNWSLPGLSNDEYFALIRNFRRHAFVLLTLFGASPALCPSFVAGRDHGLQRLSDSTLYLPHATSLRMGRLGYQSEAQSQLAVSYNSLDGYADSLHDAMTQPYPAYEKIGVRNLGGEYNQLSTALLQIENEFYGTIRPKRVIKSGERPLHALRERGVEYVEVRCMDLDPFVPVGIAAPTMRFIDVFLLHCLLHESPPDTPEEIAALGRNQHRTAAFGREPGLELERDGAMVPLLDWAAELLEQCVPIAAALDAAGRGNEHTAALAAARAALDQPATLPSARALATIERDFDKSYTGFIRAQAEQTRNHLMGLPWSLAQQAGFEVMARESLQRHAALEAADTVDFETFRLAYLDADQLAV